MLTNTSMQPPVVESTHLFTLLKSSIENKWRIVAFSLVVCLLAIIYSLRLPVQYKANVILQIKPKQLNNLVTQNTNPNNNEEDSLSSQMALIRSGFIMQPVIRNLGLDIEVVREGKNQGFFQAKKRLPTPEIKIQSLIVPDKYLRKRLQFLVVGPNHFQLQDEKHRLLLEGNVGDYINNNRGFTIKVDKIAEPVGTRVTVRKYSETDVYNRVLAKVVLTELSPSLSLVKNGGLLQLTLKDANPEIVTKVLNEIALVAQKKDRELKSLAAENTLEFLNQQLPVIQKSLHEAEAKLNLYRASSGKIDLKLETQYLLNHLSNLDKQLEEVRLKKTGMSELNTIHHPFVVALDKKYNELNKQRDDVFNKIKKLPADDQVALNLARDVNVKSKLYMILLNQIHAQTVIKAGIASDINILTYATNPESPLPKSLMVIGIASLFIGALLGCIFNLACKIRNRRVDDPTWIEQNLKVENLITLPYNKLQAAHSKKQAVSATKLALPLLALNPVHDAASEALRMLRTILQNKLQSAANNIIAFMSLSPNSGKTFVTANVASLLAMTGKKILVIDADIRRGHMQDYFPGTIKQTGLTNILQGEIAIEDAIVPFKPLRHLWFLSTGTFVKNSADLLVTDQFRNFLAHVSKQFDHVVINAATLTTTDSLLIAEHAGINLLIIGANMHKSREIELCVQTCRRAGITLHGAIYNHLQAKKSNQYLKSVGQLKYS